MSRRHFYFAQRGHYHFAATSKFLCNAFPNEKEKAGPPKPAGPKSQRVETPDRSGHLTLEAAALVLLVCIAYWNSLVAGFHFDDEGIFLDPYVMGPGFGWKILRLTQTRPLTFLSFHWNYLAAGSPSPAGFHWVNMLLHAANSLVVLLVARRTLTGYLPLFAAALFAIHPLQTQAVNYVFERATLLATFFALLSLLLFLRQKYRMVDPRFWNVATR